MKGSGWFKESLRHSMASRGLPTGRYKSPPSHNPQKYFQQKTVQILQDDPTIGTSGTSLNPPIPRATVPTGVGAVQPSTILTRLTDTPKVQEVSERLVRGQRQSNQAVLASQQGNVGPLLEVLDAGSSRDAAGVSRKLTSFEREGLQTELSRFALQRAQAGLPVADAVTEFLDPATRRVIERESAAAQRGLESPFKQGLRDFGKEAGKTLLEAPERVARGVIGGVGLAGIGAAAAVDAELTGLKALTKYPSEVAKPIPGAPGTPEDFPGLFDRRVTGDLGLRGMPFLKTNVFTSDEDEGRVGWDAVPKTSDAILGGIGLEEQPRELDMFEKVQRQVDGLFSSRGSLSEVDLSSFSRGTRAFENGKREDLIDSIAELQGQEAKLKDRSNIVDQVHNQVLRPENVIAAGRSKGTNPVFDFMGGGVGDRLADQTKKLNKVKVDLKKSNDKAFARRKMLEFRLQRLDAQVPPESGAPVNIERFGRGGSGLLSVSDIIGGVENPVTRNAVNPVIDRVDNGLER